LTSTPTQTSQASIPSLFIGHSNPADQPNRFLFHYDLGQVILTKHAPFSLEHLTLLMHLMDTNIAHLDTLSTYDFTYLNGLTHPHLIHNLQSNFNTYANAIKLHLNVAYHPRSPQIYAIKAPNTTASTLMYVDLATTIRPFQESTIDRCLARIGGLPQMLILLARTIEVEDQIIQEKDYDSHHKQIQVFTSLKLLESLLNLINKRPAIHESFKRLDGYSLLRRIYTSIASLNRVNTTKVPAALSYYFGHIQTDLFCVLLNACFRGPVICRNNYSKEQIEVLSGGDSVCVVNGDLLTGCLIEWSLWLGSGELWKVVFKVLDVMLQTRNLGADMFHSSLFIRFGLVEKLIQFVLDANEENYVFEESGCESLIRILRHFNSINSSQSKTKVTFFLLLFYFLKAVLCFIVTL